MDIYVAIAVAITIAITIAITVAITIAITVVVVADCVSIETSFIVDLVRCVIISRCFSLYMIQRNQSQISLMF